MGDLVEALTAAESEKREPKPCLLDNLPEAEKEAVTRAFQNGVPLTRISELINAHDFPVGTSSVARHLKRKCGCVRTK